VMVIDDPDAEEVETSFLTWWDARAKDACAPAAAVRWAVVAEDDGTLELQLQGIDGSELMLMSVFWIRIRLDPDSNC